jgi:hypothetical protein
MANFLPPWLASLGPTYGLPFWGPNGGLEAFESSCIRRPERRGIPRDPAGSVCSNFVVFM